LPPPEKAFDDSIGDNFSSNLEKNGFLRLPGDRGDVGDFVVEVAVYIDLSGAYVS
jgi:hypothetical protein